MKKNIITYIVIFVIFLILSSCSDDEVQLDQNFVVNLILFNEINERDISYIKEFASIYPNNNPKVEKVGIIPNVTVSIIKNNFFDSIYIQKPQDLFSQTGFLVLTFEQVNTTLGNYYSQLNLHDLNEKICKKKGNLDLQDHLKKSSHTFIYTSSEDESEYSDKFYYQFSNKLSFRIFNNIQDIKDTIFTLLKKGNSGYFNIIINPNFDLLKTKSSIQKVILAITSNINEKLAKEISNKITEKVGDNAYLKIISPDINLDFKKYNSKKEIDENLYNSMINCKTNNFSGARIVFNQLVKSILNIKDTSNIIYAIVVGNLFAPTSQEIKNIELRGSFISAENSEALRKIKNLEFIVHLLPQSEEKKFLEYLNNKKIKNSKLIERETND